jgi:AraC-like DNA-binding protein
MRDYVALARLCYALDDLGSEKVEVAALAAGFKTRTGFYRWFHRMFGMNPAEFRMLSQETAAQMRDALLNVLYGMSNHRRLVGQPKVARPERPKRVISR